MVTDPVGPNLLQDCVLKLLVKDWVVSSSDDELLPVKGHVLINHNFSVWHGIIYQIILRLVLSAYKSSCKNLLGINKGS